MDDYDIQSLFDSLTNKNLTLSDGLQNYINIIIENAENQKGVLTVILTGLIYKLYHPSQDVRLHQTKMGNGYSGRTFDTAYITPFLKKNDFPAMAESGWLTRSLEQSSPYTMDYKGEINNKKVREAFLKIYDATTKYDNIEPMLSYLFKELIIARNKKEIKLSIPKNRTISDTLKLFQNHINFTYTTAGAARLPNLAIYAAYQCFIENNQGRYANKKILPLNSHTAADSSTGSIGDIQINDENNNPFEGIEIKARDIKKDMLDSVYCKIQEHKTVSRYYILSTHDVNMTQEINDCMSSIRAKHGCEIIVNGVFSTLKYFLRLTDTDKFIEKYVKLLGNDAAIKYEHKEKWNELCSEI